MSGIPIKKIRKVYLGCVVSFILLCFVPAESIPFHNLHQSSATNPTATVAASAIGVVQRTGTLVQSPVLPKPYQPFPSTSTPSSKSPLPPLAMSNNLNGGNSTTNSPEPTRFIPVYSADGTQRDSFSVLSSAAATAGDHTIHAPDSHHGPRKSVPTATVDHANRNHSDSARHVATASPAPSNAGSGTSSRKVSAANAPDPTRLMRMKGETYFAEMIDRVWESRGGGGGGDAAVVPAVAGTGFDRIEGKISQCMSLVTEHVLMAVRADLDGLTTQAKALKERAASLEYENHVLRTENVLLRNAVNNPPPLVTYNGGMDVTPSRSRMRL